MKDTVLKSLMRLFAIVSQVHSIGETDMARRVVEDYLKLIVRSSKLKQFLIMFDFYQNNFREREVKTGQKQLSLFSVKAVIICDQINKSLDKKQKLIIAGHILEILIKTGHQQSEDIDFVRTIALALRIEESVFNDLRAFVSNNINQVLVKRNILVVGNTPPSGYFRFLPRDTKGGYIVFFYIELADLCFYRIIIEKQQVFCNNIPVENDRLYLLAQGSALKNPFFGSVHYSDIIKAFQHDDNFKKIIFCAENLSYRFPGSDKGVEPLSFCEESGQLIGIMGSSGVGKSTFLNLLNGNLVPATGRVLLNGYDIHANNKQVEGLIGFIPQDELLVEELSIFENLYLNARLCFSGISKEAIARKVMRMLHSLGLAEIKDNKVGTPLNSMVSGGQRKRLNIALELIREPQVLFVDEPTSGLSSSDANHIVELLKNQCYKGKLIFLNIHQPSNEIFRMMDKLILLDKGGRVVFMGKPVDSAIYLKKYSQLVNAEEGECPTCGNLNPDQLLATLEAKKVNELGEPTNEREIQPEEWYTYFRKNINADVNQAAALSIDLPPKQFSPPSKFAQFKVFTIRNILSRVADKQYLLINLMEAPLLAFILGWFTRHQAGNAENPAAYIFGKNINIPAYLFISVIVALFMGLMISAEEIIRHRRIIKREAFLHLSRWAYYNSKIVFLAGVLAVQVGLYVVIGNSLLGIRDMFLCYWLLLWVTSLVACLTGLILSAVMDTVVSIYIAIPLLLIPQLMLGGAFIKFDKLNARISHPKYVPIIGDIMPSRWAYEALATCQFTRNRYEKHFFEVNRGISNSSFMLNYFIPELNDLLTSIKKDISTGNIQEYIVKNKIGLLFSELENLEADQPIQNKLPAGFSNYTFNITTAGYIEKFLDNSKGYYRKQIDWLTQLRDEKLIALRDSLGSSAAIIGFKDKYYNENLADMLQNKDEPVKIETKGNMLVRKADPVYQPPTMPLGRSHFYSAEKRLGPWLIETFWFNISILLLMAATAYFILVFEVLVKIHSLVNRKRLAYFYTNTLSRLKILLSIFGKT
ncbi:MAG: ATP-binding cassette domain-containing protein [Bacteroidales bacterium]|nr:ATP-binding cassette domain-containing protein [Bacteroidales bacterium]